MSTLELEHLKHTSSSSNNLSVHSDGSLTLGNLQSLNVVGDVQAENTSGHRSLTVKGNSTTNYQGGSLLLANSGMDTNYGGTYLYHHKAGGSGTQNAAFNISQRTAAGAYVSNIWNVDYQNSAHSFYVPNGGISGGVALGITSAGHVTKSVQPSFCTRLLANTTTAGAKWTTNGTPQHNVGNHWSTSTHRFTAPVAGRYLLLCSGYTNFTTSYGYMNLYINGTNQGAYSRHFNHNGHQQHTGMSMNMIWDLNANDYVEWGRGGAGGGIFDIITAAAYLLG